MPDANLALIERFYRAFDERDGEAMAACYAPDVRFSDPVFPDLRGARAGAMWRMLTGSSKDLRVELLEHEADEARGSAHWRATLHVHPERPPGRQRRPRRVPVRGRPDRRAPGFVRLLPLGAAGARDERAAARVDAVPAQQGPADGSGAAGDVRRTQRRDLRVLPPPVIALRLGQPAGLAARRLLPLPGGQLDLAQPDRGRASPRRTRPRG